MSDAPVSLLEPEDLEAIVRRLGLVPRDRGLLAAAAARPATAVYGEELYSTVTAKAAAIMHSIVTTHPLVDGNKRLGWIALVVTLDINDIRLDVDDDEAFALTMAVADGSAGMDRIIESVERWIAVA